MMHPLPYRLTQTVYLSIVLTFSIGILLLVYSSPGSESAESQLLHHGRQFVQTGKRVLWNASQGSPSGDESNETPEQAKENYRDRILHQGDATTGHIDTAPSRDNRSRRMQNGPGVTAKRNTDGNGTGKQAKLAFLILSDGRDVGRLHLLLPAIYHPDNIYLVHVDAKAPPQNVAEIRKAVEEYFPARDGRPSNGRMLEPAGVISWGGYSLILSCMFGIASALRWDNDWDYFINISTADYPVLTQVEMRTLLGDYAPSRVNFMEGKLMRSFEKRWKGYVEDQSIHRDVGSFTENAMTLLGTIERPYPQLFSIYKGEFWTILHRSFCQYVTKSPDNVARSLAAYFTGFRVSDESYFQTVACHPEGQDFPVHGDSLRFANWNEDHFDKEGRRVGRDGNILLHPEPISEKSISPIMESGVFFARKFDYTVNSIAPYGAIKAYLEDDARSGERLNKVRKRIGKKPNEIVGRNGFCKPHEAVRLRRRLEELEAAGDMETDKARLRVNKDRNGSRGSSTRRR